MLNNLLNAAKHSLKECSREKDRLLELLAIAEAGIARQELEIQELTLLISYASSASEPSTPCKDY